MEINVQNLIAGSRQIDEMKAEIETFVSVIKGALTDLNHPPTGEEVKRETLHWNTEKLCVYNWYIIYGDTYGGKVIDIGLCLEFPNGVGEAVYIHNQGCALERVRTVHQMLDMLLEVCLSDELLQTQIKGRLAPYFEALKK